MITRNSSAVRGNPVKPSIQRSPGSGLERLLRRKQSTATRNGSNEIQRKKQKTTRTVLDNGLTAVDSPCGLEEVELSQSDAEQEGREVQSPISNGSVVNTNSITTPPPCVEAAGSTEASPELQHSIPLSHRRSERSKSRQQSLPSDAQGRLQNVLETIPNHSSHNDELRTCSVPENTSNQQNNSQSVDLRSSHNDMKAEVIELKRDKRAYSSAIIALREKSDQMVKDLHMKTQQIMALEDALSRKRNPRGSGKGTPWSMESLSKCGLDRYQGICLTAGKYGTKLAKLLVTESYIDEKNENYQKQDWTPSSTKVTNETGQKSVVFVKLPDGVFAIPVCSMVRAMKAEFFTSRFKGPIGLLKASLLHILEGPVGSYLDETEREECIAKVSVHRPSIQKYRAIISDVIGNRKKSARNIFLKSLGYKYAPTPDSKKDSATVRDLRYREKDVILERCVNGADENDTTYWRTCGWESLCPGSAFDEVSDDMISAEKELEDGGKVDNLFMNEAARRAFLALRGYSVTDSSDEFAADSSILYLARADASMTTMLKFVNVKGKGESRNDNFVESFRFLLPKALAVVIKDVWTDLELLAPHELNLNIGNSNQDSVDPYGNSLRDWTVVQKNPDDNHTYLLASPRYFREKVCSWYGTVKDGHIGRYNSDENEFVMITSSLSIHELEESDIDD